MVRLIKTVTREYAKVEKIKLCCKSCGQTYADLVDVKSQGIFWEINESNIDWDVEYTLVENDIFCKCYQKIGKFADGVLFLYKGESRLSY